MMLIAAPAVVAALAAISLLAGFSKGLTGFGGALVMAPLFGMLIGARDTAVLIVLVHCVTSLQGVREWGHATRWRAVLPLGAIAVVCAALAAPRLAAFDASMLRHAIALAVIVVTVLHVAGWRWRHGAHPAATLAAGMTSGVLTALAGLGGPPAVFYFAGVATGAELRANLLGFFALLFGGTALLFACSGRIGVAHLGTVACLTPLFALGVQLGTRNGHRLSPKRFDMLVSLLLMASGCIALVGPGAR